MFIFRLLLLFLAGLLISRLWRAFKTVGRKPGADPRTHSGTRSNQSQNSDGQLKDITEQDIDDADFEEIP